MVRPRDRSASSSSLNGKCTGAENSISYKLASWASHETKRHQNCVRPIFGREITA